MKEHQINKKRGRIYELYMPVANGKQMQYILIYPPTSWLHPSFERYDELQPSKGKNIKKKKEVYMSCLCQ